MKNCLSTQGHGTTNSLWYLCNFTEKDIVIPAAVIAQIPADAQILISNHVGNLESVLRPYEARVYRYNVK